LVSSLQSAGFATNKNYSIGSFLIISLGATINYKLRLRSATCFIVGSVRCSFNKNRQSDSLTARSLL
jgi:hypothetical protein